MATTTLRLPSRATRTRKADSVGWGSPVTYFIAFVFVAICIGPVLIIVMAIIVGFLLLSIFLPLFRMIASIH